MKSKYTGLKRIFMALKYSIDGIASVFKTEAAFRQDLLLCIVGWCILPLLNMGFYHPAQSMSYQFHVESTSSIVPSS